MKTANGANRDLGAKEPMVRNVVRIISAIVALSSSGLFTGSGLGSPANTQSETTHAVKKRNLVVTRTFDAPVESVWKAWTDPEHVKRWWGPTGFTSPVARIDFREGGTSLVCMRAPGGQDFYNTWTYRKIVPAQLIEFVLDWADKEGNRVDPATMGLPPNMPRDVRHVITFKAVGNKKTEMTITEYGYTSDEHFELSKAGLEQCLDKMAAIFARS